MSVAWGEDTSNPERMWRMAKIGDGCWEWIGGSKCKGYGAIYVGGNQRDAHRLAWELTNGPIPDGTHVLHECDNPGCVRPSHLFLGTHADNMGDMGKKGRNPGHRKLSAEQVLSIRRKYAAGVSRKALATEYQITAANLWYVVTRRTWRNI